VQAERRHLSLKSMMATITGEVSNYMYFEGADLALAA
jgi:hypothetical protein